MEDDVPPDTAQSDRLGLVPGRFGLVHGQSAGVVMIDAAIAYVAKTGFRRVIKSMSPSP